MKQRTLSTEITPFNDSSPVWTSRIPTGLHLNNHRDLPKVRNHFKILKMKYTKPDKTRMNKFYNVLSQDLCSQIAGNAPFDGIFGVLEVGEQSEPHSHHESEVFIALEGEGIIACKTESQKMEIGVAYFSSPFESHWIKNVGDQDLKFLSLWWDSKLDFAGSLKDYASRLSNFKESAVFISATPPTPNGDLHLGHMSGPFLNSDILRRIFELQGVSTFSVSGLDNNQNYVVLKAKQDGVSPESICSGKSVSIKKSWDLADIKYDFLIDPGDYKYKRFVDSFFRRLYDEGIIVEKESEVFFDEDDNYIFEAFIVGDCPHCGSRSDGLACEQCGMPNDCVDLRNPVSKISKKLEKRKIKRLVLKTRDFLEVLDSYLEKIDLSYRMEALRKKFFSVFPDIAITHPTSWGIKSTIAGFEDQVYYVWAEMAPAFIYASLQNPGFSLLDGDEWSDRSASFVQCFGFDNAYFYMFLFPALWLGYDKNIKLPDRFITNEFLCLDGSKFSTSRNHAVWGNDILNEIEPDYLRFYLALVGPFKRETDFRMRDFKILSDELWIGRFAFWVQQIESRLSEYFDGEVPSSGAWSADHTLFYHSVNQRFDAVCEYFSIALYNPNDLADELMGLIGFSYEFSCNEHNVYVCEDLRNMQRTSINIELNVLYSIGVLLYPIMPNLSKSIISGFELKSGEASGFDSIKQFRNFENFSFDADRIFEDVRKIKSYEG